MVLVPAQKDDSLRHGFEVSSAGLGARIRVVPKQHRTGAPAGETWPHDGEARLSPLVRVGLRCASTTSGGLSLKSALTTSNL